MQAAGVCNGTGYYQQKEMMSATRSGLVPMSLERYTELYCSLVKDLRHKTVQPCSGLDENKYKRNDLQQVLTMHNLSAGSKSKKEILDRLVNMELFRPFRSTVEHPNVAVPEAQQNDVADDLNALGWLDAPLVGVRQASSTLMQCLNSGHIFQREQPPCFQPGLLASAASPFLFNQRQMQHSSGYSSVHERRSQPGPNYLQDTRSRYNPRDFSELNIENVGITEEPAATESQMLPESQLTAAGTQERHDSPLFEEESGSWGTVKRQKVNEGKRRENCIGSLAILDSETLVDLLLHTLIRTTDSSLLAAVGARGQPIEGSYVSMKKGREVIRTEDAVLLSERSGLSLEQVCSWLRQEGHQVKSPGPSLNAKDGHGKGLELQQQIVSPFNIGGANRIGTKLEQELKGSIEDPTAANESKNIVDIRGADEQEDDALQLHCELIATLTGDIDRISKVMAAGSKSERVPRHKKLGRQVAGVLLEKFESHSHRKHNKGTDGLEPGVHVGTVVEALRVPHDPEFCELHCQDSHEIFYVRFASSYSNRRIVAGTATLDIRIDLHDRHRVYSWDALKWLVAKKPSVLQEAWVLISV